MASEVIGDGFEIPVRAEVEVDFDAARLRSLTKEFGKSGNDMGKALAKQFVSQLGPMNEGLKESIGGLEGPAADKVLNRFLSSFKAGFREAAQAADAAYDDVRRSGTVAAEATAAAFTQAAQGTEDAREGSSRFNRELKETLDLARGLEGPFEAVFKAIAADLQVLRGELSVGIVDKQAKMQQDGILKAQRQMVAQAQKDENREKRIALQAGLREQEQARQASNRETLLQQRTAASQANSILNASMQEELIQERAHQQRRSALIRAGLDATRSAYQSIGSGTSSLISGMYARMRSDTEVGENRITASNRAGLLRRKQQTEAIMQQTTSEVRRQVGLYQQTQQQLDKGVVGAVAGTSAFGAGLRGLALGAGGAFGLSALIKEASGFEANLRVFAELNEEIKQTPALMELMRQTAFDLGNDLALPGVSAADAADAMTALAKTGLTMENSIGAARASLLLARVAGIDFAESARTIGGTLNALKLEGEDATKVVDGLAAALKLSGGASFDEIRQGQQQALLVFRQTFQFTEEPLEIMNQLNASLALFSQNALRGSDAGTSLKTFLQSLQGKSDVQKGNILDVLSTIGETGDFLFDEAGNARGFAESIDLVRRSFNALDPATRTNMIQEIFGADAARAASIFISSTKEELDALVAEVAAAEGLTLRLAKAQNQGLMAGVDAFVSTVETIFIRMFAVVDKPLGNLIVLFGNAIGALAENPSFELVRQALLGIAAGLLALAAAKAGLEVLRLTGTLLSALVSPAGLIGLAFAGLGAAFVIFYRNSETFRDSLANLVDWFQELADTIKTQVSPVIENFVDVAGSKIAYFTGLVAALFKMFVSGDYVGSISTRFGIEEDDPIIGVLFSIREAFVSLWDTVQGAGRTAANFVRRTFRTIADAIGDSGIIPSFAEITSTFDATVSFLQDRLGTVISFFQAAGQTIRDLGIFEGLRQTAVVALSGIAGAISFVFGGIFNVVGEIFSGIASFIADRFKGINWAAIMATAATGIFGFFFLIGNAVGQFIGSDEFLATVSAALLAIAGVLVSAASGLVSGFIDGLRRSDMGRRLGGVISEELGGAFDVVKQETLDAATLLLSNLFPPIAVKRWITDPFQSGFSTVVLIAEVWIGVKLVQIFAGAFRRISDSVAGFRQVPNVLRGGLESIAGDMNVANKKVLAHEQTIRQVTARYGALPGAAVRGAAAISGIGDRLGELGKRTADVGKITSHLSGPLPAAAKSAAASIETTAKSGQQLIRNWWDPLPQKAAEATRAIDTTTASTSNLLKQVAYLPAILGGFGAGFGIGTAITSDDPIGKITGIGIAITGLGTIWQATSQVIAASGLTAGLLTGGLGVAVLAITAAVTYFATRGKEAKQAAEQVAQASKEYVSAFGDILSATSGGAAQTALEFFSRLNDTGSTEFEDFRTAVQNFGLDMQGAARAVTGTESAYEKWAGNVQGYIDDNVSQIERWKKEVDEMPDPGFGDSAFTPEQRDLMDQIRLLEERNELLRDSLLTIGGARKAYEEALSVASEELLIRRNMKALEDERKTAQQVMLDKRREERDAINEVAQSMRDLIALEEGRRAANAGLNLREQARQIAESQRLEEGRELAPFDIGGALAGQVTEGADNAMRALQQLQDAFADTAAEAAASTQTAEDYMVALALQQMALEKLLVDSGMKPEDARVLAEAVVAPFREAEAVVAALIARIGDDLDTLKQRMEGSDAKFGLGDIQNEEARKAIEQFLEDPSEKTIKTLVDMGIPTKAIEDFVRDPKEATIKTIVDSVTFLDAQGKLNGFKAPIDTVVRPVVDPASKAAVDAARAEVGQGIAIPFVFVPGKMEKKKVFGFGPMQNQNVIVPAGNKYGSVISEPTLTWVGEEKRKEVIIPLTMPQRAAQLYKESGLGNVLAQAGVGVGGGAAGGEAPTGGGRTDTAVVDEIRKMRTDLRGMAEERMDVRMYLTRDPADLKSARTVVRGMRKKRRRG